MPIDRASTSTLDGPPPISDEAVALFNLAREIMSEGDDATERWEGEGGRRREYLTARHDLHYGALGRKPWETDVVDTVGEDAPPSWMRADRHAEWHQTRLLRIALEEAAADVA
jgi:hypothetical protein